jgi:ABC-type transport system involved in cytochrome bd biosynthesis fused ATPase/permease subunit
MNNNHYLRHLTLQPTFDAFDPLAPHVRSLWQITPFLAVIMVLVMLLGAMAIPTVMVSLGVSIMDKIRQTKKKLEPAPLP